MAARPRRRRFGEGRPIEEQWQRVTNSFLQFQGMLGYLGTYLEYRLLPREPEENAITRIILALQNILEYESELAIAVIVSQSSNPRDHRFQSRIEGGYVTFKSKFEWLRKKGLISKTDEKVMDTIREIRNEHVHWRPSATRRKLKYFGTPLLTRRAVKQILLDVQPIVGNLRGRRAILMKCKCLNRRHRAAQLVLSHYKNRHRPVPIRCQFHVLILIVMC